MLSDKLLNRAAEYDSDDGVRRVDLRPVAPIERSLSPGDVLWNSVFNALSRKSVPENRHL
jgi:hypothetical protein